MLTLNELFSGIGSQSASLERLGIDFKVVGIAEIDKDATLSYAAIHHDLINQLKTYNFPSGEEMSNYLKERNIGFDFKKNKPFSWKKLIDKITGKGKKDLRKYYLASILSNNYGDISRIDKLDYADFWTYSFPCQDISVAGKQAGIEHGKTRSGLLYEVERLLEVARQHNELPKYLMLENVKNLVGKKFKPQFEEWIKRLDELGYNTKWQILNSKNYGIPQNRERVFGISIRKDIDTGYVFPEPFELEIRLKDVLEKEVDEKFYLSDKVRQRLKITDKTFTKSIIRTTKPDFRTIGQRDLVYQQDSIMGALVATDYKQPKQILEPSINQIGMLDIKGDEQIRSVYGDNGLSSTLNSMQGGNRQPKVLIPQATKKGHIECNIPGVADLSFPDSKTRRGRVQENGEICPTLMAGQQDICYIDTPCIAASRGRNPENPSDRTPGSPTEQRLEVNQKGTSNTITTRPEGFKTAILPVTQDYRIRKLTPKECWRLMGFRDEQFQKAQDVGVSNSQLYKQAGNSIVVDVLYYLFKNLFVDKPTEKVEPKSELPGQMNIMDFMGG